MHFLTLIIKCHKEKLDNSPINNVIQKNKILRNKLNQGSESTVNQKLLYKAGVPNLGAMDCYQSQPGRDEATQQEVSLNAISLNHPKITPTWSVENLSFMKPVSGTQKFGDCWSKTLMKEMERRHK